MKRVGVFVWAASLTLVIGAAVSTLLAQGPVPAPAPGPRPGLDRQFRVLEGRGSRLGVTVQDLTADDAKSTAGVRIEDVARDSAAEKAGLKERDVVVEFDGERVRSARQFSRLVQETPDGRTVRMAILREGQKQIVDVTPERLSAWTFEVDGDRIRRDVERGLRGLERMPYLNFRGPEFDPDMPMMRGPRGRLGVQLEALAPQLAEFFGAKDGGVLVSGVTRGSAAEKAGLKAGDVIVSLNGARVRDVGDLRDELRDAASGDISIDIIRDRKPATLKGTMER